MSIFPLAFINSTIFSPYNPKNCIFLGVRNSSQSFMHIFKISVISYLSEFFISFSISGFKKRCILPFAHIIGTISRHVKLYFFIFSVVKYFSASPEAIIMLATLSLSKCNCSNSSDFNNFFISSGEKKYRAANIMIIFPMSFLSPFSLFKADKSNSFLFSNLSNLS